MLKIPYWGNPHTPSFPNFDQIFLYKTSLGTYYSYLWLCQVTTQRYLQYSNRKWITTSMSMVSRKLGLGSLCLCLGGLVGSLRFSDSVGASPPGLMTAQTSPGTNSSSSSETGNCRGWPNDSRDWASNSDHEILPILCSDKLSQP